jgi:hypothetical protein
VNQNEIKCDIQAERDNDESIAGEEEGTATPPSHSTVLSALDAHSDIFKEMVIDLLKNLRNSVIVRYLYFTHWH